MEMLQEGKCASYVTNSLLQNGIDNELEKPWERNLTPIPPLLILIYPLFLGRLSVAAPREGKVLRVLPSGR